MRSGVMERLGLAWQRTGKDDYQRSLRASTDGRLVYAIGDVHGRYDLLKLLLSRVADDARQSKVSIDVPLLIFLGDYIDRGPQSSDVLEALLWLQRRSPFEVEILRGNHEQCLLDFIVQPAGADEWFGYGGTETLQSYGVLLGDDLTPAASIAARDALLDRMPSSHLKLIESMPLTFGVGDYAFVHAGIRPDRAMDDQDPRDLLWIRSEFLETNSCLPKIIVHGHSWSSEAPQLHEQRIGLDTGAYITDVLTAARLHDGTVRFLRSL